MINRTLNSALQLGVVAAAMDDTDLATIVWRAPEWINALGGLRMDNIIEYFSQSPFFDRRSNNAVLRMQSQFQNFGDVNEALRKMTGTEFVVSSCAPPDLFTILKQEREGVDEVRLLSAFMIVNGNIYLAPDAHRIVSSRALNVTQSLKRTLETLHSSLTFDPANGHTFQAAGTSNSSTSKPLHNERPKNTENYVMDAECQSMHKVLYNTINRLTS